MKKPTLDQIAKECGVTKGLVSRALGGKNNVSDATREKIIRKATELGYDTSKLKVHKVSSNRVLLIGSSRILFKEDFWQPIITAISSTLSRSNLIVEYFAFEENKIDDALLKKLKESSCSAFIIIHVAPQAIIDALVGKNKPIVIVDPKTFHSEATQFKFSNYDSSYLAVQRLIEQGHRYIAFYGSDSHSQSFRERHEGYMACMEHHQGEVKPCSIIFNNDNKYYSDEEMLINALNNNPITAIVCANDIIALNAIKVVNKLDKKVPDDISVIGFDNIRAGEFTSPKLSTFNIPRQEIGEEVAKYVANSIKSHQIAYSQIVIRCDFIERESNKEITKQVLNTKHKIYGQELNNMPFEPRPEGCDSPLWRYSKNPVISMNPFPNASRVFNSAVMAYKGEFIGVFRADTKNGIPFLFVGHSKDGINFNFEVDPIVFHDKDGKPIKLEYAYDPRLVELEGTYYVIFCTSLHGPTLGVGKTKDFKDFELLDNPFLPFNRNGVLFPRKINGQYAMFSRPSDSGHTQFGDIFLSYSKDLEYWGHHRHVMERGYEWWCGTKIGAGPTPIETDLGWLVFFHGANLTCSGLVYSIGAAIVDRDDPSKVLHRCGNFLLAPEKIYETSGYVPNVLFPVSCLTDSKTGRIAIYAGGADTVTELLFTDIDTVIDYILKYER